MTQLNVCFVCAGWDVSSDVHQPLRDRQDPSPSVGGDGTDCKAGSCPSGQGPWFLGTL